MKDFKVVIIRSWMALRPTHTPKCILVVPECFLSLWDGNPCEIFEEPVPHIDIECLIRSLDAPDITGHPRTIDDFFEDEEPLWGPPLKKIKPRTRKTQSGPRVQIRRTPDSRSGMKGITIRKREGRA